MFRRGLLIVAGVLAASACATTQRDANGPLILPGFLDLPLQEGQWISVHATAYPFRFASVEAVDRSEIEPTPYVATMQASGWRKLRENPLSSGPTYARGEGDGRECVMVDGGLTITFDAPVPPRWTVKLQQVECELVQTLWPGVVNLPVVPGNWVDLHTPTSTRIITTEGFRQRMFDVYVEDLRRLEWKAVESGGSAIAMRRSEGGPCLGVRHYKARTTQLNMIDFHLVPGVEPCSLPPSPEETSR